MYHSFTENNQQGMTKSGIFHTAAEYDTDLEKALYMGHQPEYRQPNIHEQTEPALSSDWRKAEHHIVTEIFFCSIFLFRYIEQQE